MSSIAGVVAYSGSAVYAATKHGLIGFTKVSANLSNAITFLGFSALGLQAVGQVCNAVGSGDTTRLSACVCLLLRIVIRVRCVDCA